ncbi:hypothetical protein J3R82DRAFT_2317 [Butyriboletus roseoflavus]|nr:hypothetical protein J3R82DRAFT_2317 [Butyriboletus roseoflavus]
MSQSPPRRLAVRRGSVSALDPLGKNAALNHDPNRSSSSTLTIVRVVDPASSVSVNAPLNLPNLPSSPTHHRRSLRRNGSTSGPSPADNRLSFAFSSFSPVSPPQPSISLSSSSPQNNSSTRTASSPSASPRLRPSSPQFTRRHSASGGSTFSKPNLTPEQLVDLARQSSAPRFVPGSANPSNASNSGSTVASTSSPATFTLLPVDVYLPFIDRAAETTHLLSIPPTKKLFSLLAQTFPMQTPHEEIQNPFTIDPAQWTFNTLRQWLTEVDRSSVNDAVWVRQARKCILAHSELIWERLKGALGVPPELEEEDSDTCYFIDPEDSASALSLQADEHVQGITDHPDQFLDSVTLSSSPGQSLTIETILATSSSNPPPSTPGSSNPPPSSLPAGLSQSASKSQADQVLQDIVEDREEEEEPNVDTSDEDRIKADNDLTAQIHGLRVCTSPVPSSSAVTPHVFSYPPSPAISTQVSGRNSVEPRSPDFSLSPLTRRLSRSSSHGSTTSLGRPVSGSYIYRDFGYNVPSSEIGDSENERAYDPAGDRAPGNPLFPSNFARLALGPTLRANNPALRTSHATTPRWARWAPGSRPPSWFEGWDGVKQEYAATVASGSSVGAGE